jgi:ABC-type nitrate/sulfonate/bicarbonate transport system substrate-binding protein
MKIKKIDTILRNICLISIVLIISMIFIYPINDKHVFARENVTIKITSTPTPNMIPAFLMLEQSNLSQYGIEVEYIPSKDVSDIIAHLTRKDIDFVSFSIPSGIKIYNQGIKNIKLIGVHVWKAIYVIGNQNIDQWEDLIGERILIPFRGGEPDIIVRASMKSEGFNPDKDFRIEYLSVAHIKRLLLLGQVQVAVLPEPHISQLLLESKENLQIVIRPQQGFSSNIPEWGNERLPLGGFWLVSPNLRGEIVQKVVTAFAKANQYAMNHPEETANITYNYFKKYFHGLFPEKAISDSLKSGRLELDFKVIKQGNLESYIKALGYPPFDKGIYYDQSLGKFN